MRPNHSLLIAIMIAGLSLATSASAKHGRSGAELLEAAEKSFSSIPFGTKEPPPGLKQVDDGGCATYGECTYVDANHVRHYFGPHDGTLVVKSIRIADVGGGSVSALGIGMARSHKDVVDRVQRFLPEAQIDCSEDSADPNSHFTCGAMLGEGWITLSFNSARCLEEAKIDAYHFT